MSDPQRFHRVVADVIGNPWAILPDTLNAILSVLAVRATGQRVSDEEVRAAVATREAQEPIRGVKRGVAVLPVFGILGQRMNLPLQMSGGTSTELLSRDFHALVEDDRVSAIVLAVDSPGGSVYGTDEMATQVRAARGRKPIIAAVSSLCASAAYWIAAQADRVIVTPGGDVGSIGVLTCHEDISAAQEKLGVKTTIVSAGKFKAEANPFAPLTDEARATLQRRVDECHRRFIAAVAAGRGVSEDAVRDGFGQGRLLGARDALVAGLVDEIGSINDVIADVATTHLSTSGSLSGSGQARSVRATRQELLIAATRQEPALDDWRRGVSLSLRLLDL